MSNCVFTRSGIEMEAGLKPGQLDSTVVESVVNMKLAASRDVCNWYDSGAESSDGEDYAQMIEDQLKEWDSNELSHLCKDSVYDAAYRRAEQVVETYCELLRRVK
jgi:hypothetical protein